MADLLDRYRKYSGPIFFALAASLTQGCDQVIARLNSLPAVTLEGHAGSRGGDKQENLPPLRSVTDLESPSPKVGGDEEAVVSGSTFPLEPPQRPNRFPTDPLPVGGVHRNIIESPGTETAISTSGGLLQPSVTIQGAESVIELRSDRTEVRATPRQN